MILITGAAGFIGSAIAHSLNNSGFKTLTIDNFSTGYRSNLPKETILIEGDCGDPETISQLQNYNVDTILHFAGQSSGEVSFNDPLADQKSNTTSTLLLLNYAKLKGIRKFIYASSMSVYGDHENLPVTEQSVTMPKSLYAVGKLASEHYLNIYSNTDLKVVSLRLFNVYGPGQNLANLKQGMLSIYLAQALKDGQIKVKGSLERFRDLVYIDDVVEVVSLLVTTDLSNPYSVYNVANAYPVKVKEMITSIKAVLGNISVKEIEGTQGDQFGIFGSNYSLMKDFGWKPKIKHITGIKKMIAWSQNQR
jgi:UDP-glucose 4-epimerase